MTTDEARTTLSARIATALLGRTAPHGASLALDAILTAPAEELAALGLVRIEDAVEVVLDRMPATQDMTSTAICDALKDAAARLRALAPGAAHD